MTSQTPEKSPSRKQKLQEKQRRQLAVVDTVDKAEAKLRKAEAELAEAVAEAVEVFGSELGASDELELSVEAIRHFLDIAEGGSDDAEDSEGAGATAESTPAGNAAKTGAKTKAEQKADASTAAPEQDQEPEPAIA
ncbi:hypothetical protein PUR57_21180 [Streptomyces sp. JV176]|uniref:hypothetical protein n=1 Tax=Streptomyces sp. JV176 TaxID=858630 RepID=UPI002E789D51|nr:hypothetical protein [Streptomyces sp. JV176]MEE1801161.1 hypothetical protein [Streptomyces sp. JV176]